MADKIAITPRSLSAAGHPALSELTDTGFELVFPAPGATPGERSLLEHLPDCVGWLAGVEPISAKVLDGAPRLKVISRNGVGVDNIDREAALRNGVAIERAVGANARGVAELAIALMLAGFRHIPWSDAHLRGGDWQRRKGIEAKGRTLGVVGCGAIGQTVAEIALGLGMNVLGYDPYPADGFAPDGFKFASLDAVLDGADAVSLHCPPGSVPLIDASAVARMKQGCVLINTARSELIDETAVLEGLDSSRLASFATDVYPVEPPAMTSLLTHERTILMPHAGGFTDESVSRATTIAVRNLLKVLRP